MFKRAFAASALALAAASTAHANVLLTESFDNVAGLSGSGWVLFNLSSPIGTTNWFQGDSNIFASQAGAPSAYIAANFNNAAVGGTISNLLLSPVFSTVLPGTVSFFAKADIFAPYSDTITYGISSGTGFVAPTSVTLSGDWTQYTFGFAAGGAGSSARFAISYNGPADTSNYIGIDTVAVTAVPEPAAVLMLACGLAGLGLLRRRAGARG